MKKVVLILVFFSYHLLSQDNWSTRHSFFQPNNISTVFIADGVFNLDRQFTFSGLEAGLIWPVSSPTRKTINFASGIWVGAKAGPQRELRLAAAVYNTHFTPGNIPVIGQVPSSTVCSDTTWKVYLVNLNDPSLLNGGSRTKIAGGRTFLFSYVSWAAWPVAKGAPYAEINGIPGYQPSWNGDRPGIGNNSTARPEELCFMIYMDYTNCSNNIHISELGLPGGSLPLGIEIHQLTFAFRCPEMNNTYFVKWKLINKSTLNWDSAYVSLWNDPDLGNAFDDGAGSDSTRNLGFVYNGDNNDPDYGPNPPTIGNRILQGPLQYTGNSNDTAKLPYDTLIGYVQRGLTSYYAFRNGADACLGNPEDAAQGYNFMKGFDGCGNPQINWVSGHTTKFKYSGDACNRIGWIDSFPQQRSELLNSGPFVMNVNDTQIIVVAQMIARDGGNNFQNVCALQSLSDSALKYYYNDFGTCIPIGIQPISSEVPDRFALYQNYPNPFNPATIIRFSIANDVKRQTSNVKLVIFDILGREIATLVNEELKPGTYEVEWNAENYPSGVYFYYLQTIDFTAVKKMIIIK